MGHDGDVHSTNNIVARDAYGYTLNYFNGDYRSIATTNFQATGLPITSLYNGNIAGATYSIKPLAPKTIGTVYTYDQLNRYIGDTLFKNPDTINNTWSTRTGINDLKEKVSYDENGNILLYLRHGNTAIGPLAMDSLTYHYTKGRNQLAQVNDAVGSTNYTIDIDNETSKYNYKYNGIGELAKDSAGGLDTIIWTVYGKIKEIKKHNGDSLIFFYDPTGNRLEKRYYPHGATSDTLKYTRDVKGNILAMYDRKKDTVRLIEWDIHGANMTGSLDTLLRMQKPTTGVGTLDSLTLAYLEGQKQYELINNKGSILATVSDKKTPIDTVSTDTLAKYYLPVIVNAQSYYPYGMVEPGRSYLLAGDSSYRFSFDGKLHDDQIYGTNDSYDYGARIYNPRLGIFFAQDALKKETPGESPYAYTSDSPILFTDLEGHFKVVIDKSICALDIGDVPSFLKVVNSIGTFLQDHPALLQYISDETGISTKQILKDCRPGKGPTISIEQTDDSKTFGMKYNDQTNRIIVDVSIVLEFESHLKFNSNDEKAAYLLIMAVSILHEYTHWGDHKTNNGKLTGQTGTSNMDATGSSADGGPGKQIMHMSKTGHRGTDVEQFALRVVGGTAQGKDANNNYKLVGDGDLRKVTGVLSKGTGIEKTDKIISTFSETGHDTKTDKK